MHVTNGRGRRPHGVIVTRAPPYSNGHRTVRTRDESVTASLSRDIRDGDASEYHRPANRTAGLSLRLGQWERWNPYYKGRGVRDH